MPHASPARRTAADGRNLMSQQRDHGITRIHARPDRYGYGMGLGIMLVDEIYPGFPGDVRNASALPLPDPVRRGGRRRQSTDADLRRRQGASSPQPILDAARRLERFGCRAIAAECGYFAYFQPDVAGAVDVPVFMSSLLQVPWMQQLIGSRGDVGILCAERMHARRGPPPQRRASSPTAYRDRWRHGRRTNRPQFDSLWERHSARRSPPPTTRPLRPDMVSDQQGLRRPQPEHPSHRSGVHWFSTLRSGDPARGRLAHRELGDAASTTPSR